MASSSLIVIDKLMQPEERTRSRHWLGREAAFGLVEESPSARPRSRLRQGRAAAFGRVEQPPSGGLPEGLLARQFTAGWSGQKGMSPIHWACLGCFSLCQGLKPDWGRPLEAAWAPAPFRELVILI